MAEHVRLLLPPPQPIDATCNNFPPNRLVRVSALRTVTSFFQSKDLNIFLILILVIATW
jgi:hypothetical protein